MKTIVLGYDGTEPAKRALERAAELAKALESKLIVTSVAPVLVGAGKTMGPVDPTDPPELHRAELREAQALLGRRGLQAEYTEAVGEPADAIVELAEQRGADLIVVGTREPNFLMRMLGQSVSGAVARQAHCDVLIVH
jgi:nucleotide-binding universal stress UspA family protein